jgi:hypothetical protein
MSNEKREIKGRVYRFFEGFLRRKEREEVYVDGVFEFSDVFLEDYECFLGGEDDGRCIEGWKEGCGRWIEGDKSED